MAVHKLVSELYIPASVPLVWAFFCAPSNLQCLTPHYMKMRVTSGELPAVIYAGQIITYKVSPLLGVPISWTTEITHVEPGRRFVDDQRRGPFKLWHHQHLFEPHGSGTSMIDIVHYEIPLWIAGEIAHRLFVRRQIEEIFEYRRRMIEQCFPRGTAEQ
jgi:ligand-binding SRPBCC domain-containing protein